MFIGLICTFGERNVVSKHMYDVQTSKATQMYYCPFEWSLSSVVNNRVHTYVKKNSHTHKYMHCDFANFFFVEKPIY